MTIERTTGHAPRRCPHCDATLDAHGSVGGGPPAPGDWSLCAYCGRSSRFGADGTLRAATARELADMPDELRARVEEFRRLIHRARRESFEDEGRS